MTDATTADVIAAVRLIDEHGLETEFWRRDKHWVISGCSPHDGWEPRYGEGPTFVAAVLAWAEAAGVPWPTPQVENRWTFRTEGGGIASAYTSPELAAAVMEREGYGETATANYVVPCEVVIRETKGGVR